MEVQNMTDSLAAPFVDQADIPWKPHQRYPSVDFKPLISADDNAYASVAMVRFPSGGVIGLHAHPKEIETIYCLAGTGEFTLDGREFSFSSGQIIAVPAGVEHGLRNERAEDLLIITFFTPPLF
jgi:quercetin dioxygenase-like cupin family protein